MEDDRGSDAVHIVVAHYEDGLLCLECLDESFDGLVQGGEVEWIG